MLQLTDAAKAELIKYFKDNTVSPIRVFMSPGGCSGPSLSLALDEANDNDESVDFGDGITLIMDKKLLTEAKPVTVEFGPTGFSVESPMVMAPAAGGGGCGGCCGCG